MNKIDEYINKQKFPQKDICMKLRTIIFETFPTIKEEMKWGVPAFGDGSFYIVALKDHVNLGFAAKGLSKEEIALFDGGGKTTKNIGIKSLIELDQERIIKLLKLVDQKLKK
jgi:hypothetical protein